MRPHEILNIYIVWSLLLCSHGRVMLSTFMDFEPMSSCSQQKGCNFQRTSSGIPNKIPPREQQKRTPIMPKLVSCRFSRMKNSGVWSG